MSFAFQYICSRNTDRAYLCAERVVALEFYQDSQREEESLWFPSPALQGPGASKADMDEASSKVSEAFHLCPNLDVLVPALREGGLQELERRCTLKAGPLTGILLAIATLALRASVSQSRLQLIGLSCCPRLGRRAKPSMQT